MAVPYAVLTRWNHARIESLRLVETRIVVTPTASLDLSWNVRPINLRYHGQSGKPKRQNAGCGSLVPSALQALDAPSTV